VRAERRQLLSAQQWFGRTLAVFGIFLAACGMAGWYSLQRTTATTRVLTEDVGGGRVAAERLRAALIDQETGVRGYLLTHDGSFLGPYQQGLTTADRAVGALRQQMQEHPAVLERIDGVVASVQAWHQQYVTPTLATNAAKDPELGKKEFDQVRAALDGLDQQLTVLHDQQTRTLENAWHWRNVLFFSIGVLILAGVLALAIGLHRGIVRPLRQLGDDTREVVRHSRFDHAVASGGTRELRQLGADIETMRQRIVAELVTTQAALDGLQRSRDELSQSNSELESSSEELRRSNAELEQFAYVASHDLQEPLRKISSFCQLLERRYNDQLDERGRQYIAFAVDGAARLQVLINDLLTFSRVGRTHNRRADVDLAAVAEAATRNVQATLEEKGGTLTVAPLPGVVGDATLLTMLMQNLFHNAIKFAHPERTPAVEVTCEQVDDFYQLAVTDNGIGIPPEFAEKVFIIFQRLHARDAFPGTGIGLAVCKKIVEYHGGQIWIDPDHTDGARICFTLPVPQAPLPEADTTDEDVS